MEFETENARLAREVADTALRMTQDAYTRGYIDGLEAAANTIATLPENDALATSDARYVVRILRDQATKLREAK